MKTTTKFAIGSVAVVALSAGVAGVTAYAMMEKNQDNTSFYESFETASPLRTAAFDASSMQPVDLTKAAESTLNSVVHIMSIQRSKIQTIQGQPDIFDFFFGDGRGRQQQVQTPEQRGFGSGVIISKDGYIVTNNHVIDGADEINVKLHDGREMKGRVIGTDPTTDLALVKIEGDDFPAIVVGNSDNLKVGEWVLAVGNPFNLGSTVTAGVVSAKSRGLGANQVESFIQTDAAINAGNSGGALVNTQGELVGINAMLYSQTGSYSGYGFAIPTSIMNKVVDDLKKYGSVQRVMLSIQGSDVLNYINAQKENGKEVNLGTNEGVYIAKVDEDGNGAEAGLKEGDVITKVDGKKVTKMAELQEILNGKRPGDKMSITYLRNKKASTKTITLKNAQGNTSVIKSADLDVLGGSFRPITESQKNQLNIKYGVEVMKVNSGALKDGGISRGFIIQRINDNNINTIDDLQKAVKSASTSKDPVLYIQGIWPTGKKAYFAVPLQKD
jgi:Do/DeqQ family serine protease